MADDDDEMARKTNPIWWRKRRAAEVRRQIADQELQRVLKLDQRIWAILTEARIQKFSPEYNRIETYYDLKHRVEQIVGHLAGDEARKRGLGTSKAYDAVIFAVSELLPPDITDLLGSGDLTDEEAEELRYPDGRDEDGDA